MAGRGVVSLAVAFGDVLYGLVEKTLAKVGVVLCLDSLPPAPNCGVDFLLDGGLVARHLPLPAGREVTGVGLWEWRGELRDNYGQ